MRRSRQLILAIAVAAMAVACDRPASDRTSGAEGTAGTTPAADTRPEGTSGEQSDAQQFVTDLGSGNLNEIELGRIAQQKASSPDVKAFGEMMVRDHTKALDALKEAAAKENLRVPAIVNEKHRELRERLSALSGAEFDKEYMNAMVEAHQATVKKLEDMSGDRPAALKEFASTILPTVRQHLDRATQVRDRVSGL
jgi:putative membrane protein